METNACSSTWESQGEGRKTVGKKEERKGGRKREKMRPGRKEKVSLRQQAARIGQNHS